MVRARTTPILLLILSMSMLGCTQFTEINEHGGALRGPDCDCYKTDYDPEHGDDGIMIVE